MNMLATIVPKSDQLNSDDLIGRTLTIKVTRVTADTASEQPVSLHFEGDEGKPYKPGKSMRRVLVQVWGPDGNAYPGRSLTLYRDDKVQFGGMAVGGIRISHMSHIERDVTMALTATRGNKKAFTVKPLREARVEPKQEQPAATAQADEAKDWARDLILRIRAAQTEDDLHAIASDPDVSANRKRLSEARPKLEAQIAAAFTEVFARLSAPTAAETDDGNSFDADGFPLDVLPKQPASAEAVS